MTKKQPQETKLFHVIKTELTRKSLHVSTCDGEALLVSRFRLSESQGNDQRKREQEMNNKFLTLDLPSNTVVELWSAGVDSAASHGRNAPGIRIPCARGIFAHIFA